MPRNTNDRTSTWRSVQKRSKSVACQNCHSRKVKCSGGQPCLACRSARPRVECIYPQRDRQIKLSQQYVEALVEENERLRNSSTNAETPPVSDTISRDAIRDIVDGSEALENPLFEERPWFLTVSSLDMPILIGEAADAAFATRFRQALATVCTNHLPRMSYLPDVPLLMLSESQYHWPTAARARFLVKVAFSTVCRYYHIIRKSVISESLETAIKNGGNGDRLVISKLLALFALGDAYSARSAVQGTKFPGLAYFVQARRMVNVPAERPHTDTVEIALLLGLYSYTLNRRHSAYMFASSAIRNGLIMGMQLNVPEQQNRDRLAREHCVRLWWTAYILDRTCASKIGLPVSIADDDILVNLPSGDGLERHDLEDFGDFEYELCSIELSRIAAKTTREIYSRRSQHNPFSQRVQAILKDLNRWMDTLPAKFHLEDDGSSSLEGQHIIYLHLSFNQGVILATRPILLHVLRVHQQSWTDSNIDPKTNVSDSALLLAETCIQCARHSYRIITDAWIHGTFATFDYFNTQFLFSAATILAISGLLGSSQSESDNHNFDNAVVFLRQLDQSGSYGAKEFCEHIDAMQKSMAAVRSDTSTLLASRALLDADQAAMGVSTEPGLTAGMALAEPSFQDFLAETDLDIQEFDSSAFDGLHTLYWPEIWGDGLAHSGDI
ncbi:fungal-specific transcription factor domain-containing protein [Pyrenochaeta sp. MPI-SDFR-AT-0127]|nr:fungal-specific transcription factor domain-containing protein [Pyrenochaeta sp. MPI-SDFR-AT-0127]